MAYTTKFKGALKFTNTISMPEVIELKTILGEYNDRLDTYVDFELLSDYSGIKHNNAEKSYKTVEAVNLIITHMHKKFPDFGLSGRLLAQGEEIGDVWYLVIKDNVAIEERIIV